jgi:structural maintenance of chromosome 2
MINVKVDSMSDQAEREFNELIKKKDKMSSDKLTIEKQIQKLDSLKNKTLEQTFTNVTASFSNIFRTLLPGADAVLELADPNDI